MSFKQIFMTMLGLYFLLGTAAIQFVDSTLMIDAIMSVIFLVAVLIAFITVNGVVSLWNRLSPTL